MCYIENEIGIKTVDAAHYGVFICLGVVARFFVVTLKICFYSKFKLFEEYFFKNGNIILFIK